MNDTTNQKTILVDAIERYFKERGYKNPDYSQAMMFAMSEFGEAADIMLEHEGGWVRNNPDSKTDSLNKMVTELGDAVMMLFAAWICFGKHDTDPVVAMLEKMSEKTGNPYYKGVANVVKGERLP